MSSNYNKFSLQTPWLSKSGVLTYDFCPRKFYLKKIEDYDLPESDALQKGIKFHNWIDELFDNIDKSALINGETTIREEYKRHFPDDFEAIDKQEVDLYTNFIEMDEERWEETENKEDFFPIKTEEFLSDEDLMFHGAYDRLDKYGEEDGEDVHIVYDYKTGSYKNYRESNYRFQLCGYRHLIHKNYDKYNVKYGGIIFPKEKRIWTEELKTRSINAFEDRVKRTRDSILDRDFSKTGYCKYCDFDIYCR